MVKPPNFCREKDKWKNERHQYDLYEYEQSVKVIENAIYEFSKYRMSKEEYKKEKEKEIKKNKKTCFGRISKYK